MRTLNAALIAIKNRLSQPLPWAWLFDIELAADSHEYYNSTDRDLSWDGETWTAAPMAVDVIRQSSTGRLSELNLALSNVGQLVSAYIHNSKVLGKSVTAYLVNTERLDITTDVFSWTWQANAMHADAKTATVQLGHDNIMNSRLPWQRYVKQRCRHTFRSSLRCNYPNDEFDGASQQDFTLGLTSARKVNNYTVENQGNAVLMNTNITTADNLTLQVADAGPHDWWDTTRCAPSVLRPMKNGVDVSVKYTGTMVDGDGAYLVIRNGGDVDDWVAIGGRYAGTLLEGRRIFTLNGVSTPVQHRAYELYPYWRILQGGPVLSFYDKQKESDTWILQGESSMTFEETIYVGLFVVTDLSGAGSLHTFDWLRFDEDAETTSCDKHFDSVDGCLGRKNTRRYGGAPALRGGRLYGI